METSCQITTPLPADALRLHSCTARESLSVLGEMNISALSTDANIAADKLLGKPLTVTLKLRDDSTRELSGYVTRFTQSGSDGGLYAYQMTVRPWLWLLTRTADCRIFQDQKVPDIVKAVFQDHAVADFEFKLLRQYRTWNYCVQYRETDFNFVARLLEHEGIYWYFEHKDGKHKLVLADSSDAHSETVGLVNATDPGKIKPGVLPFYGDAGQTPPNIDYARHWVMSREIEPGKVVQTDYDFERPSAKLETEDACKRTHDLAEGEVFDYPGGYIKTADGKQYAENRIDELHSEFEVFQGAANTAALRVGHTVKLERHPRDDQNAQYLITGTSIQVQHQGYESGSAPASFHCDFRSMGVAQQFRPTRRSPKPVVHGPQTAVVVGPGGEEIFTDKYGRVKVQFHWDREAKKKDLKDKSSCWVRVSQPWAGKTFGAIYIPRIGQEVVVGFLEGDPDQPLITGRVYNAEQMPPWELPANATQSGVLTRSSKGGGYGNANAIRFEDKAGSEQLWIHAEKNQDIEVENDETHWVGHDRTKTIDHDETVHVKHDRTETVDNDETITVHHDRTETVDNNETISIGVDRSETVGSNETISIGVDRTETVGSNETITIGSNRDVTVGASESKTVALQRTHTVGVNETITVGAAQEITIGAMQAITVGANQATTVGVNQSNDIGSDRSLTVGGSQATSVGKKRSTSIADDDSLTVGKNLTITASDSITLKTGSASITMKKDGTITIKGKDITIEGSGKINAKASSDIVMKGSKILQN